MKVEAKTPQLLSSLGFASARLRKSLVMVFLTISHQRELEV